jgi:K+-transporting ATPase KdpF subunit
VKGSADIMNAGSLAILLICVLLFVYLMFALLRPEKF